MQNTQTSPHIGLLGGSFNPPHRAHLALALAARAQLGLTRVDLMPAGQPWQKAGSPLASAAHRLAMCEAATHGIAGLGVQACEIERTGNTYTVDTLRHLRALHPWHHYTLILGADQVSRFDSWHDWAAILTLCTIAVAARNGEPAQFPPTVQFELHGFRTVDFPASTLSSSRIRALIAAGKPYANHVPAAVERYIVKHSLYQNNPNP